MARLPQVTDYGARPGLRSNRVDLPGSGDMQIASALENAASTFAKVAVDHKQKEDALSYSAAKNEYLIADIKERAKLKEDQDYATFDERYRSAMKGHYERIFPAVTGKRDRIVFDAEARLMNERGAVEVGDLGRKKEIDFEVARYEDDTVVNKQAMLVEDSPAVVNDMMLTQSDRVDAMVERGYMTREEGQAEKQRVVQSWAYDRLIDMDPKMREQMLERSINGRQMGGPVTPEDIRVGKGTDSIADFLHFETAVKMLRETQKENEVDDSNAAARAITDIAYEMHPENFEAASALARQMATDQDVDSQTRESLERMIVGRSNEVTRNKTALQDAIVTENTDRITKGDASFDDISGVELSKLEPHQINALKAYSRNIQENRQGFAEFDQLVLNEEGIKSYAEWSNMSKQQKADENLDTAEWMSAFTPEQWQNFKDEQKHIKAAGPTAMTIDDGLSNKDLVLGVLVQNGTITQTNREPEQNQTYQRTLMMFDNALQAAQREKGARLNNTERRKVLADVMGPSAFTDDYWDLPIIGPVGKDTGAEKRKSVAQMTADELKQARLPLDASADEVAVTYINGTQTTFREELEAYATMYGVEPSTLDYEKAYFAWRNRMGDAEIARRLGLSEDEILKRGLK